MSERSLEGPIVVFGATGFLGVAVVRELLRCTGNDGFDSPKVVALVRSRNLGPSLTPLAPYLRIKYCEQVTEDVLNDLLYNDLKGEIKAFVHVAGLVRHSADPSEIQEMHFSNVGLSNIIFSFAAKHSIRTMYASTSGVVGCQYIEDKFRVAHDDGPLCTDTIAGLPYYEQKAEIERTWRPRAMSGQCPIVFLRPSLLLGPGDDRLSTSKVVLDYIQGRMTFLPQGGISFMDVRDAAAAIVMALTCNVTPGTAMNLTAANIPFQEFAAMLEEITGVQAPKVQLPGAVARASSRIATTYNSMVGNPKDDGKDPVYVEIGQRFWNVTCQRALQLLEFEPRDPLTTLRDSAKFLHYDFADAKVNRNVAIPATAASKRISPAQTSLPPSKLSTSVPLARRQVATPLLTGRRLLALLLLLALVVLAFAT